MIEMRKLKPKSIFFLSTCLLTNCSSTVVALAQSYPNFGFQSYSAPSRSGIAPRSYTNSFNTGFSSMSNVRSRTSQSPGSEEKKLQQLLNAVDTPQAWAQTPITPAQPLAQPSQAQVMRGMMPKLSRRELTRIFLEGGTPQQSGQSYGYAAAPSNNSAANTSTAYTNYQQAENESARARNAAQRARYDKNKWDKQNDASRAEYAANNANYAAQRAESAAYNGDSQARGYANLAREAANRARESANQARYNADTAS